MAKRCAAFRAPGTYLSTKVGKYTRPGSYGDDTLDYSRSRIRASLDESAARLGVEYFDLIHIHDIEYQNRRHTEWALTEGYDAVQELKREGRIGGVSFGIYPMDLWVRILSSFQIDAALVHNHHCLNDTQLLRIIPLAAKGNVGIINASPFASGLLTDRGAAAWHPASDTDQALFREAAEVLREARRADREACAPVFKPERRYPYNPFQLRRSGVGKTQCRLARSTLR